MTMSKGLRHYILTETREIREVGVTEWALWCATAADRRVKLTEGSDIRVSTIFLGIDHRFGRSGPPLLFETMVFRNDGGKEYERYSRWDDAVTGHDAMVRRVFRSRCSLFLKHHRGK